MCLVTRVWHSVCRLSALRALIDKENNYKPHRGELDPVRSPIDPSNLLGAIGSEEEACGGTFPTFLDRGANDKKDLAFKVEGEDHFVDPTPNRVDHSNLTL